MIQNKSNTEILQQIIPEPENCDRPFPLRDIQYAYRDDANIHEYIELEGKKLDLKKLNKAWNKLIERHEMLRATILPSGEQQISEKVPYYEIQVSDLTGQTDESVHENLEKTRREMSHQIFQPDRWPLFDIRITCYDGRARLHVSLSFLMFDFTSYERLFREWVQLYQNPEQFPEPLELSFRDYVLAEKKLENTELYHHSQAYWSERLKTMPSHPVLPMNHNAPRQLRITRHLLQMDPELWCKLKYRAEKAKLTPVGLTLVAFISILADLAEHPCFMISLTFSDRLPFHPKVNDIIGNFSAMLPFEVGHLRDEPFAVRAERIQKQLDTDMAHRYVNGISLIQEISRRQTADRTPAIPVGFTSGLGLGPGFGIAEEVFGEDTFGTCQRPNVFLEHEFVEVAGVPWIVWMEAEGVFPENMIKKMADAHQDFLNRLAVSEAVWAEKTSEVLKTSEV